MQSHQERKKTYKTHTKKKPRHYVVYFIIYLKSAKSLIIGADRIIKWKEQLHLYIVKNLAR